MPSGYSFYKSKKTANNAKKRMKKKYRVKIIKEKGGYGVFNFPKRK